MFIKRPLLICGCCYAAACILATTHCLPSCDSFAEGSLALAVSFPSLPAASFAIVFTFFGLERFAVPAIFLGYTVHIVLVLATVSANGRLRYAFFCVFFGLLVADVFAVVTGVQLLHPFGIFGE